MMEAVFSAIGALFKGKFVTVFSISLSVALIRFIAVATNIVRVHSKREIGEVALLVLLEVPALIASVLIGMVIWVSVDIVTGNDDISVMWAIVAGVLGFNIIMSAVKISFDKIIQSTAGLTGTWLRIKLINAVEKLNNLLKQKD